MIQKFNSLSHKLKLSISAFSIIFVLALLMLQISSISALNGEIEQEKDTLLQEQLRLESIKKIAVNYEEFKTKISKLEKAIPATISEETLMTSVQSTASFSSNDMPTISILKTVPKPDYQEVPFTVSLSGTFNKFLDLITNIKTSERAVKITSITLSKDSSIKNGIKANVQASAFISVPVATPVPAATGATPTTATPAK